MGFVLARGASPLGSLLFCSLPGGGGGEWRESISLCLGEVLGHPSTETIFRARERAGEWGVGVGACTSSTAAG